jgi:hypothetical protein
MNIITAIVALFQMNGSNLTGNPWTDVFLDKMVGIETWFYNIAWWVWAVAIVIALILIVANKIFDIGIESGLSCGCVAFMLILWPLMEWISVFLIRGAADNFNATVGVTNGVPFVIYLLLYITFGAG